MVNSKTLPQSGYPRQDDLVISYNTPEVGDIELSMITLVGENA